jgi:large subunit ribosomal protein L5
MTKYESLHDRLKGPIAKTLKQQLKVDNIHALPKIQKVIVNVGINRSKMEGKEIQEYVADCLKRITGQKPVFTRARKAISNFKIRQNLIVGAIVTLRGRKAEEFVDRLLSYALPRVRDFRGLPSKLDGHGNYSLGLRDHSIFPEVPPSDAKQIFGMQILIATNAGTDEAGRALFNALGMPFRKSGKKDDTSVASTPASADTPATK